MRCAGAGEGDRELLGEMVRQGCLGRDKSFEIVVFVTGGAAAPFGIGGRRGILGVARRCLGQLFAADLIDFSRGFGTSYTVIGSLEQRVSLELLLHEGHEVEIGQLQQLDRLHQLRRHDQRLRLPEL
ncbi:hypothetical protein ABH995_000751 [Bradyrhizobium yuanmingense]